MIVIKAENLGKKYLIGHDKKASGAFQYNSLRDSISHSMRGIFQRIRHPLSPNRENTAVEDFWALKNINFSINQGDKIGIIGHNGAGKTTLLKLLSRITQPTTGSIKIKGRIASLLEVGTGFHPELSGRENIYLNGAILGMNRAEIKRKFDEIIDFAEIEKFLDTPVKRYSSGMYVRLAFAVAAHLEPEILLVDEVLAVGDAAFQKKSLGKMEDVSKEGRTIIFISHNMHAMRQLCERGILLNRGMIQNIGSTSQIINEYQTGIINDIEENNFSIDKYRRGPNEKTDVKFIKVKINNQNYATINIGESIDFYLEIFSRMDIVDVNVTIRLINEKGESVVTMLSRDNGNNINFRKGMNSIYCKIKTDDLLLLPGKYYIASGIDKYIGTKAYDVILNYPAFKIINNGKNALTVRVDRTGCLFYKNAIWKYNSKSGN